MSREREANIFDLSGLDRSAESFLPLLATPDVKIERIASFGQASPPGFWYDQERAEWILLLAGSAGVLFADEADVRVLAPGDHLLIPARRKHRVEWTDRTAATIWLAVHFG